MLINYGLNKAKYIETYCENKSTPEMGCNGKCHLRKEIAEVDTTSNHSDGPAQVYQFEISDFIVQYFVCCKKTDYMLLNHNYILKDDLNVSKGFVSSFLKPPIS